MVLERGVVRTPGRFSLGDGWCLGGFDVGEFGELVDDADGFDAYGADALEEVDDVFLVVGKSVGVDAFADGRVCLRRNFMEWFVFGVD